MGLCAGIRADGGRCRAQAIRSEEWCFNHHPDYEDARRRRASRGGKRGGRGRPQAELASIKDQLQQLADKVLANEVERADAAVAGPLLNVLLRAVSVELKVKELTELEERLEALEQVQEQKGGGRRWGA